MNTSLLETNTKNINIDGIKNPFNKLIDKKLGFSCKLNNNLFEIKYGFEKIFIDGFYETKDYIKLPFNENKFIEIPIDSVIFLEIEINSSIKQSINFTRIEIRNIINNIFIIKTKPISLNFNIRIIMSII